MKKRLTAITLLIAMIMSQAVFAVNPPSYEKTENQWVTWTTADGGQASSVAGGKAKALIFFGCKCSICHANLCEQLRGDMFYNVDIVCIDGKGFTQEDVKNYRDSNGLNNYTFCINEDKFPFRSYVTWTNKYYLPVILYVGPDNKVGYMTTAHITREEFIHHFKEYCGVDIVPAEKTANVKISRKSGGAEVTWDQIDGVAGYQVQYSLDPSFRTKTTKKATGNSITLKKLESGKKYYVRVRSYRIVSGKTYKGVWSDKKAVRVG